MTVRNLLLLLVLLALAGCAAKTREVELVRASVGPIRESFVELAETRLRRTYTIAMPTTARLERIDLEPGDRVRRGQVLARLDLERETRTAAEALHEVEQVRAQMVLNDDRGVEEAERAQALEQVEAHRATLRALGVRRRGAIARQQQAAIDLSRVQELFDQRYVTSKDLDDARLAEKTARLDVKQVSADIAAQQRQVAAATERVRQIDESLHRKRMQHDVLQRQTDSVLERVGRARHEARVASVKSPIDGVVLERLQQGPGEIPGGTPLLILGTMRDLEVMSEVLTEDAMRVRVGTPVRLDAGVTLPGVVDRFEPAGFTKRSSLGVEQKRVRVIVRLLERPPSLGVGYRLQARFITAERKGVKVPRFALMQTADGSLCVLRVEDGKLRRQVVETGLRSDTEVEVRKGVREGEAVVKMPESDMQEGERVRVR